jgi:hypothetical protein
MEEAATVTGIGDGDLGAAGLNRSTLGFESVEPNVSRGSKQEPIWIIFMGRFGKPMGRTEPRPCIQLCQTFNMDRVTQDQMRARLFLFSLLEKALQWFYSQPTETVQDWNALMSAFMKEYYSPGKMDSLMRSWRRWR